MTDKASERDELARKFKELSNKHGFRGHSAEMLCEEQAEIVLAREQSLKQEHERALEEIEKPLKELWKQFQYFKAYQAENLVYGQTLKTASENWDSMVDPHMDFENINQALETISRLRGKI